MTQRFLEPIDAQARRCGIIDARRKCADGQFHQLVDEERKIIREQLGVRNDDAPAIIRANERRPRLNVLDRAFMGAGDDLITDAKRLRNEEQDAGEEDLENVPEGEPDRDTADTKHLHNVARA
jgi:hypothetical protein